jgi:Flp pilus assembly protein CpaB
VVLSRRRPLAAVCAAVAVLAVAHEARPPRPATVAVEVAARDLPSGAVLGAADLVRVSVPADLATARTPARVVGRTLAAPVRRGEPVTDVRLVGPALAQGYPGLVALPVRIPDPGAVALLRVGDRIDLVAADPQGGGAEVVATDVPVMALPRPDVDEASATGLGGRLVVVGAAEGDIERIADASVTRFLTFVLSR